MELYQLKGFAAVAEQGHLTRAADRLHVSQPALSAQIKALEEELGVELFERMPTGMALTAAGRQLLPAARNAIAAAQAMRAQAKSLTGEPAGKVRLGIVGDAEFVRLPLLLSATLDRLPLVEIEVHHEVTGAAFAKVREGGLDAAFYYGDLADPDVAAVPLRDFDFCVAAPVVWRDRVVDASFAALAELPWILTPPISTHRALSDALFARHRTTASTLLEADNEGVIRSLVVAGLGVALMRDDVAAALEQSGEACLWSGPRLPTRLQFVWREEHAPDPALSALREIVEEVWALEPAG